MMKRISLEEGLSRLEGGISKAKLIMDGIPSSKLFTSAEQMNLYDCVYSMSVQYPPHDYSMELYELFESALKERISSKVLPSLMNKDGATLLVELCNMWSKYKAMAKCLGVFFLYLDRHFTYGRVIESLKEISFRYFRDLVYDRFYQRYLDAAISVINQDREQSVDEDLLKNFSTFLVEMKRPGGTCYESFENAVLENAANYYHRVASQWIYHYSSAEYFHKAQWCLNKEKERAGHYLNEASVKKLLQVVHWELLVRTENILTEKQKAEGTHSSFQYQEELLGRVANLRLGDRSSSS